MVTLEASGATGGAAFKSRLYGYRRLGLPEGRPDYRYMQAVKKPALAGFASH